VQLIRDVREAGRSLWHDRVSQAVIVLFMLPWIAAIAVHRNLNMWMPLAMICGIVALYWLFTRKRHEGNLPVRRPFAESAVALAFVAAWIAYRVGEYVHLIVLPPLRSDCCGDLTDTIIPKLVEMLLVPLLLFLLLRYSITMLGLGLPRGAWLPALVPIIALILEGLNHQKPGGLVTRTFSFYIAAGLPEEFLFRGLLQSRLEAFTRHPGLGMFLAAFVFGFSHLPIDLYGSGWAHWQTALESAFTFQMGVGLALGFAFQRTRNVWPLTVIHALIDAAPLLRI
jgi:CAAX protease family protein